MIMTTTRTIFSDWSPFLYASIAISLMIGLLFITRPPDGPIVSVAFIGNSMQYYNDFPRVMESLSDGHIVQNSCLHGGATLATILVNGNGMAYKWDTSNAIINDSSSSSNNKVYDFGACSVSQLLLGTDERLEDVINDNYANGYYNDDDNDNNEKNYNNNDDDYYDDYDTMVDDGRNPCFEDPAYYDYLYNQYNNNNNNISPLKWDYIVLNDRTRGPCCTNHREQMITILQTYYVPLFLQTGAIPILLDTYAYWADQYRDMSGLIDVPTFTSVTYDGYKKYNNVLSQYLPSNQQPKIAPVALGFLTVWEENYILWEKLIHYDQVHLAPGGTYLQSLIVYGTIFNNTMPSINIAVYDGIDKLFTNSRRMVKEGHDVKPFPTIDETLYLYETARRVLNGYIPKSFTLYDDDDDDNDSSSNGSLDWSPDDSEYTIYSPPNNNEEG